MLNFALVGCGRIAKRYAEILTQRKVPEARLVAVCDIDSKKSNDFEIKYNIPSYNCMHSMLNDNNLNIDIVCILTPSGMHAKHTLELVKYKKPLVVEKPMALQLIDADKMIEACLKNKVKLFVVKQNRFNIPILRLREAVENNYFGKMVLGTVRVRWCRDQSYYDHDSWRGTWSLDGGCFANQAIHHIDLLQWMMGPIESIYAKGATRLVKMETEDTGVAVITFTSGALGIIEATTATRPKNLEGSISILGENGTVEIGGFAANKINVWDFKAKDMKNIIGNDLLKHNQNPLDVYGFGHVSFLANVVKSVLDQAPPPVDGLEGRKSLEIVSAIYESIETNKCVGINFKPRKCKLGIINDL